jgi:hypothetical protein
MFNFSHLKSQEAGKGLHLPQPKNIGLELPP